MPLELFDLSFLPFLGEVDGSGSSGMKLSTMIKQQDGFYMMNAGTVGAIVQFSASPSGWTNHCGHLWILDRSVHDGTAVSQLDERATGRESFGLATCSILSACYVVPIRNMAAREDANESSSLQLGCVPSADQSGQSGRSQPRFI